jgi:hypothetical protein
MRSRSRCTNRLGGSAAQVGHHMPAHSPVCSSALNASYASKGSWSAITFTAMFGASPASRPSRTSVSDAATTARRGGDRFRSLPAEIGSRLRETVGFRRQLVRVSRLSDDVAYERRLLEFLHFVVERRQAPAVSGRFLRRRGRWCRRFRRGLTRLTRRRRFRRAAAARCRAGEKHGDQSDAQAPQPNRCAVHRASISRSRRDRSRIA